MIKILSLNHAYQCSDLHALCFEKKWGVHAFQEFFKNESTIIWGYCQDYLLVGLLVIAITIDEAEIYTLCTHPKFRYQNIADTLLIEAHKECKNRLVTCLNLEVSTDNIAAINCYLKHGYKKISLRKGYYQLTQGNQDAYMMQLLL